MRKYYLLQKQPRIYGAVLETALREDRQMAFVAGLRHVGKTTTCRDLADVYFDWDNEDHRALLLSGPAAVDAHAGLNQLSKNPVRLVFDELHKYRRWKQFLKGFFDTYLAVNDVALCPGGKRRAGL